jgi:hypothetical protein
MKPSISHRVGISVGTFAFPSPGLSMYPWGGRGDDPFSCVFGWRIVYGGEDPEMLADPQRYLYAVPAFDAPRWSWYFGPYGDPDKDTLITEEFHVPVDDWWSASE